MVAAVAVPTAVPSQVTVTLTYADGSTFNAGGFPTQDAATAWVASAQKQPNWVSTTQVTYTPIPAPAPRPAPTPIQIAEEAQAVGMQCIAEMNVLCAAKLAAGTLTQAQEQAMATDTTLAPIFELLECGALDEALALISAYNGVYFNATDAATIAAIITNSGLA